MTYEEWEESQELSPSSPEAYYAEAAWDQATSQSGIGDVQEFHSRFSLPIGDRDLLSSDEKLQEFRIQFFYEELSELTQALKENDRVGAFDALLDLAYITYGAALCMGVNPDQWNAGFAAVQKANMSKARVANAAESKRGSSFDVRKPEGWVGPEAELEEILNG